MQQLPVDGDLSADIIRQGKRQMISQGDIYLLKYKLQRRKKELIAAKVASDKWCVLFFIYVVNVFLQVEAAPSIIDYSWVL